MKKLACLALVCSLMVGCAALQSVGEAIGVVAETVCNFSVGESSEAQMAIGFMSTAAPIVGTLVGVTITQAEAYAVFSTVASAAQTGACVLLTDLQAALAYFDALSKAYEKQFTTKGGIAAAKALTPSLLGLKARAR